MFYPSSRPVSRGSVAAPAAAPPSPAASATVESAAKRRRKQVSFDEGWREEQDAATSLLNEEQKEALRAVTSGDNVFITGCAGTGKSFLLAAVVAALPRQTTAVTATTGCAALQIGGTTLHRWAGIGLGTGLPQQLLATVEANSLANSRWLETTHLVIDEVSMLPAKLFDTLDFIGRCVRHNSDKPFGGIVLVCTGDFAQLPPVAGEYCFKAAAWKSAALRTVLLTVPMRQRDPVFFRILSEIRIGRVSDESLRLLNARVGKTVATGGYIVATRLRARRDNVVAENDAMLSKLPKGGGVIFRSQDRGSETMLEDLQSPAELRLKVGAQVMLTRTLSPALVNGTRGVVVGFDVAQSNYPVVKFREGNQLTLTPVSFAIEEGGREVASRKQVPLVLAWAVTMHKAQGLSLDCVEVDVEDVFANGQTYVALSRCTSLEGLYLVRPVERRHIRVNGDVAAFLGALGSASKAAAPLQNLVFVLEGRFATHSKKALAQLIVASGGNVAEKEDESSATHAVVGSESREERVRDWRDKRMAIWSEEDLLLKLKTDIKPASAKKLLRPPPPTIIEL